MKKILVTILALLMMLSMASCVRRIEKDENGKVVTPLLNEDLVKSYEEMTVLERLTVDSEKEREYVTSKDTRALAPAKELNGSNYGYINNYGEWVIEPKFIKAYNFREGVGVVIDQYNEYEYIDENGEKFNVSIPNKLSVVGLRHFSEHYVAAVLSTGYEQSKIYLGVDGITRIGPAKLPLTDGVKYQTKDYFAVATPFTRGYAVGMRKTNESILSDYDNDYSKIKKKGYWQQACVIDGIGNVIAKLPEGYDVFDYSLSDDGLIIVRDMTSASKQYGLCDLSGDEVVPCVYHYIDYCSNGLYLAQNTDGFFGYINTKGETVIDFIYINAYPFSEGYAAVYDGSQWGIIDEDGNYVVAPLFDSVALLKNKDYDFNTGMAAVSGKVFAARIGDYWGLFDIDGNILDATYAYETENSPYVSESLGFVVFQEYKDGYPTGVYGLLNTDGYLVLEPSFSEIGVFSK